MPPLYSTFTTGAPAKRGGVLFKARASGGVSPPPPLPAGPTIDPTQAATATSESTYLTTGVLVLPDSGNYTITLDGVMVYGPFQTLTTTNLIDLGGDPLGVGNHTLSATGVTSNVSNVATTLPGANFTFNFPTALSAPTLAQTGAGEITVSWTLLGTNVGAFVQLFGGDAFAQQVVGNSVVVSNLTPGNYQASVQGSSDAAGQFAGNNTAPSDPLTLLGNGPVIATAVPITDDPSLGDFIGVYNLTLAAFPSSGYAVVTIYNPGNATVYTGNPSADPIANIDFPSPLAGNLTYTMTVTGVAGSGDPTPTTLPSDPLTINLTGPAVAASNLTSSGADFTVTPGSFPAGFIVSIRINLAADDSEVATVDCDPNSYTATWSGGDPDTGYYIRTFVYAIGNFVSTFGPRTDFTTNP